MKVLSPDDLRPADVLLFSPEKKSFISWAITFLSDAPVSHAALYYNDVRKTIIEQTPPQVAEHPAQQRFHGRTIHVYRHTSVSPLTPVIDAARQYLNDREPYDHVGLYMVGLLLMYKKFSVTTAKQQAIIRILKKLTSTLTHFIQQHQMPGKHPMVCSQFAAQCFDDAGSEFRLQFHDSPLLERASGATLLDDSVEWFKQHSPVFAENEMQSIPGNDSDEALCEALFNAFMNDSAQPTAEMTETLAESIYHFAEAHAALKNLDTTAEGFSALDELRSSNMFVSPGDLMRNCSNLEPIGIVTI